MNLFQYPCTHLMIFPCVGMNKFNLISRNYCLLRPLTVCKIGGQSDCRNPSYRIINVYVSGQSDRSYEWQKRAILEKVLLKYEWMAY